MLVLPSNLLDKHHKVVSLIIYQNDGESWVSAWQAKPKFIPSYLHYLLKKHIRPYVSKFKVEIQTDRLTRNWNAFMGIVYLPKDL